LSAMPTLSPDKKTLAFVEYSSWTNNSTVTIKTLDLETMQVTSLMALPRNQNVKALRVGGLEWAPDGKYLAYGSNFAGRSDIYIVRSDGSAWVNLTKIYAGEASSPVWKP
jgi:Tol biopolymer transport system component